MGRYRAIIFSLDTLTKANVERIHLDNHIRESSNSDFPHISSHLKPNEIDTLFQNIAHVYNACMELTKYQGFPQPNLLSICEKAINQALDRVALPQEISEVVHAFAGSFKLEFSKRTRAYIHALYRSGYVLGIVANLPYPLVSISDQLEKVGLLRYFESIILSSDSGLQKPGDKIYKMTIESLECIDQEVIIVGSNLERDLLPLQRIRSKKLYYNNRRKISKHIKGIKPITSFDDLRNII